ncbi:hypothetical protein HYZ82_00565 [Candidatus Nomurabacteria bacterium]|nr:hypothetical protein [Candidatus Nomurabacteria bacterium]
MNLINQHLDKNNLHHAYLLEGEREAVAGEVLKFMDELEVKTAGNPDFTHIALDSFKIEDARNLKSFANERAFSGGKKIFMISANSLLLEAQHSLLKMFEEPVENTHFFVIVPDANSLLKTLVSRFYVVSARQDLASEVKNAEKFIGMPLQKRINFIKELLVEPEETDGEGNEVVVLDSTRSKALKFLNALELILHKNLMSKPAFDTEAKCFEHFFKIRKFLRMPGSSVKMLMESVALIVPIL